MGFHPHSAQSYEDVYSGDETGGFGPGWHIEDAQPRIKELAALGVLRGDIADVGCGLGSSVIYLARRGYSVTGLDSSPTAIAQAASRARDAGVYAKFGVADATNLAGYQGAFDTVYETGLYHCLDEKSQNAYAAAVYRASRPGARWFIFCFSTHTVNGIPSPLGVPEERIRRTLSTAGWQIDHFGTNVYEFDIHSSTTALPSRSAVPAEMAAQIKKMSQRTAAILPLIPEGDPLYVPVWAIYAHRD